MTQHNAGQPDEDAQQGWRDVRLGSFPDSASLAQAWQWLDRVAVAANTEDVAVAQATGRVLAVNVVAPTDLPPVTQAAADGYAVRAADTEGASTYNPLPLKLADASGAGHAQLISAGSNLPRGSDAVLGFAATSRLGPQLLEVLEQAAQGDGIAARGSALKAGVVALPAGQRIRPQDLALLAALGIAQIAVLRRPVVRLAIAGAKEGGADALGPMLRALIARDGGVVMHAAGTTLAAAIAAPDPCDAILVAGRSATGSDDDAAASLVAAGGTIAFHGITLRPGGSSGLGTLHGTPLLLLPGEPLACLIAYDMLAGRLVRRMAGLPAGLPYPTAALKLGRKIVSAIGLADVVPVAIAGDMATPTASAEEARLPAACRAAGFVVVPETLEGHAEGETIRVHLYDPA